MMRRSSFSGKVRRLIKKLKSDKRAIMLPMFALMFAAMMAFLGLLFDGGRMYFEKRRMQVAATAGARGGALELLRDDLTTYMVSLLSKLDSGYGNLDSMQAESPQSVPGVGRQKPLKQAFWGNRSLTEGGLRRAA